MNLTHEGFQYHAHPSHQRFQYLVHSTHQALQNPIHQNFRGFLCVAPRHLPGPLPGLYMHSMSLFSYSTYEGRPRRICHPPSLHFLHSPQYEMLHPQELRGCDLQVKPRVTLQSNSGSLTECKLSPKRNSFSYSRS